MDKVLRGTADKFNSISCWINSVDLGISRSVLDLTDDDVDTMINVNVKTALYGMQVAIPYFRQQGYGHLLNISSIFERMPFYTTFRSMYSASKAALNSLTTNLAMNVIGDSPTDFEMPFVGLFPRTPQTVDDVCQIICQVINNRHPPREVHINLEHEALIKQYFENVTDFKLVLKPSTLASIIQ